MSGPLLVPVNAVANQTFQVPLSGQQIQIDLLQRSTGLYMDVSLNGTRAISGVLCQDRTWIVRRAVFGLPGDFTFVDQLGETDPYYSGLGTRYLLFYQDGQNAG